MPTPIKYKKRYILWVQQVRGITTPFAASLFDDAPKAIYEAAKLATAAKSEGRKDFAVWVEEVKQTGVEPYSSGRSSYEGTGE